MPYYPYQNQYMFPQQQMQAPQMQQMQQPAQPQQIQNGGFIVVRSETDARNYPVAPGNCMTFKIEGQPIVIEKSMGFSQFEAPHIDVYELVKKDTSQNHGMTQNESKEEKSINTIAYAEKSEIEAILTEIDSIKKDIEQLKEGA